MEKEELLKRKLKVLNIRKEEAQSKLASYSKMTFIQAIQLPENKERLRKLELNQEWAVGRVIKKKYPHLRFDIKEIFYSFFQELLDEKVKSFYDYIKKHPEEFKTNK